MSLDKLLNKSKTNYKVYTPLKVSREIVAKALSLYFKGNKKRKLESIRAVDLCCGNGNLLIVLLESLIRIHKIYHGKYDYKKKWIEGYDLDSKALEELRNRAKEIFDKYGISGDINIFNEDSLMIPNSKSYNLIIGNPPYLGEKNNREIFEKIRLTEFGQKYYEGKMDYLYFFIEKGIELLKKDGVLSYITTNYWLRADGANKLREAIKENTYFYYINNINKSVFKDALGQHNMIFTLTKDKINEFDLVINEEKIKVKNNKIFDSNNKISLMNQDDYEFCEKLKKKAQFLLGEKFKINQGIVSGCDKAFVFDEYKEEFGNYLKEFYKNKDIHKYRVDNSQKYILYLDNKEKPNDNIIEYLESFREKLEGRREVKKGTIKWWQLQWSRDKKIFIEPKIVSRQRNTRNSFALVTEEFYASADVYYISSKDTSLNIYYILGYLNSDLFLRWFKINGKYKGEYLELYSTPLKEVPIIYEYDKNKMNYIVDLIQRQIDNYDEKVQNIINDFFNNKLNL